MLPDAIPVGVAALGKNENHWPSLIGQICVAILGPRPKICLVRLVQSGNRLFRPLIVVILGFVIQKSDVEVALAGGFLQKREIVIGVRTALTVPIHYESRDAQA